MKNKASKKIINSDIILINLKKIKDQLKLYGVVKIGLFGSYARNENTDQSDIDIIVEFNKDKKNFHNFMETCNIIEKSLNKKVDIVTNDSLSPYIKPYIENEIIYEEL
ncbi:MAG TPA: nucleotidyltransferase family protein [Spirochaetota bacterium]|mgnify:CR=1 FL=1|nr:nucleotidyltransferase family protein [Spirochaetota bacterium]